MFLAPSNRSQAGFISLSERSRRRESNLSAPNCILLQTRFWLHPQIFSKHVTPINDRTQISRRSNCKFSLMRATRNNRINEQPPYSMIKCMFWAKARDLNQLGDHPYSSHATVSRLQLALLKVGDVCTTYKVYGSSLASSIPNLRIDECVGRLIEEWN